MSVSGKEIKRRLAAFTEACRAHGIKLTHQRMEVFKVVARTDEHPDAEKVFEQVRSRLPPFLWILCIELSRRSKNWA